MTSSNISYFGHYNSGDMTLWCLEVVPVVYATVHLGDLYDTPGYPQSESNKFITKISNNLLVSVLLWTCILMTVSLRPVQRL